MWKIVCCGMIGLSMMCGSVQAQRTFYYTAAPGYGQPGIFVRIPQPQRLPAKKRLSSKASAGVTEPLPLPPPAIDPKDVSEPKSASDPVAPTVAERTMRPLDHYELTDGEGFTAVEKRALFEQFERWLNQPANPASIRDKWAVGFNSRYTSP